MILADTSVWIDHFRSPNQHMQQLTASGQICGHQFVTGELAVGSLHVHHRIIVMMRGLPQLQLVEESRLYEFLGRRNLNGLGIGLVDVHLLAAVSLSPDHLLWTRDKRLAAQAERLGLAFQED